MSDTNKRRVLAALSRNDLLLLGRTFKLQVSPRMSLEELHGALAKSGRATKLDGILPELPDSTRRRAHRCSSRRAQTASLAPR